MKNLIPIHKNKHNPKELRPKVTKLDCWGFC